MHYKHPTNIPVKVHPKALCGDYEAIPAVNAYDTPQAVNAYDEPRPHVPDIPHYDLVPPSSTTRDTVEYSTVGEPLPDDEPIYEDPGHKKEKIYAWFEKKKFRKIGKNDITYVQFS